MTKADYGVREVAQDVWQITDALDDRAYLVVGKCEALLVDTCIGYGDIRSQVRSITDLPVRVALTHAHYDHMGGAYLMGEVWISAAEDGRWEYEEGLAARVYAQHLASGVFEDGTVLGFRDGVRPLSHHVSDGDAFDLGGMVVEAVALPGHTPGSTGYLVRERRVLLSGDAVTPIMCLFFPNSLSVPSYRETLEKMSALPFDRFYTGHHDVGFAKGELASFDDTAAYAEGHRGIPWQHALLEEYVGTAYLPPCGTIDADSPDFRALIGPYVKRERRRRKGRQEA
jgi:glyoxylase-like metal-dependent hydrolase (beta-lactamase superfamily II)